MKSWLRCGGLVFVGLMVSTLALAQMPLHTHAKILMQEQDLVCVKSEDTDAGIDCSYYDVQTLQTNWPWLNQQINQRLYQDMPVLQTPHLPKSKGFQEPDWLAKRHYTVEDVGLYRDVVQLKFEYWDYFHGAAHGNGHSEYVLFDAQTQKPVGLKDWLLPDQKGAVLAVLKLKNQDWLEEHILEGAAAKMVLSDNVTVSNKGITFHYAVYELGPYVLGAPDLELSWQDMQPFMQPHWYARLSH